MDPRANLIVAKDILADKRVSVTARLLLAQLCDHKNKKTGQCNPRRETLARELGVCIRTVSRALGELTEAGLLWPAKGQRTNSYEILPGQIGSAERIPAGTNWLGAPGQNGSAGVAASLLTEPTEMNLRGERRRTSSVRPSRAAIAAAVAAFGWKPKTNAPGNPPPPVIPRKDPSREKSIVRDSLHNLAREIHLPLPDEELVQMVIEAAGGAPAPNIHETLLALWKRGRFQSIRGWGLVPVLVGKCYRGERVS